MRLEKTRDPEIFINPDSGIYYFRGTPVPGRGEIFKSLRVKSMGLAATEKKVFLLTLAGAKPKSDGAYLVIDIIKAIEKDYEDRIKKAPEKFHHKIKRTLKNFSHYGKKHFIPFMGELAPNAITEGKFQDYIADGQKRSLEDHGKIRAFGHDRRYLKQILTKARAVGVFTVAMPEFILPDADKWATSEEEDIKTFTPEEIAILEERAAGHLKGYVYHGYRMGLRPIEYFGEEWANIDLEKGTYRISVEQAKRNKKKSAARSIQSNPTCLEFQRELRATIDRAPDLSKLRPDRQARALSKWKAINESRYLCPSRQNPNRHVDRIHKQWERLLKDCKIPYRHPYCLRHTAITEACRRMVEGKASLVDLAKYFGTSTTEIERTYLHFVLKDTKHVAHIMETRSAL